MMFKKSTFHYTYVGDIFTTILVLPYVGKELNMIIMLPDVNFGLEMVMSVKQQVPCEGQGIMFDCLLNCSPHFPVDMSKASITYHYCQHRAFIP